MQPSPENDEQKLERVLGQTLRALPARRAPRTLEPRVLAELERRAALPWWHRSYAHWPLVARGAFLLASAGVVKAVIVATLWVTIGFETVPSTATLTTAVSWLQSIQDLAGSVSEFGSAVLYSIPRGWLYAGIACIAATYAVLFGLGAFAYRALFANRQTVFK